MSQRCRARLTRFHKKMINLDELTPICQMNDLPLGGSNACRRESLELVHSPRGVKCVYF